jgi:hypothetical protein
MLIKACCDHHGDHVVDKPLSIYDVVLALVDRAFIYLFYFLFIYFLLHLPS